MACLITGGYTLPCKLPAGIQAFYIGNWTSNLAYTLNSSNQIATFTAGTSSMYTFQQPQETGSMLNTGNSNIQNGTVYYDQVIEFTVHGVTQSTIDMVKNLGQSRVRCISLDQNGNYHMYGLVNPMEMTALTGGLGKAYGDLYGYTITLTGKEKDPAIQLTAAAATSVIV